MPFEALKKECLPVSDLDIVQRILAADPAAFEMLMRRYNRPLYRVARSIVKDNAVAEDVLQDAYVQIFRRIGQFRGEASLKTWLTRIVVNSALALSRKTALRAEIIEIGSEPDWDEHVTESMAMQPINQPEQAAAGAEMRRLIEQKIDDLPEAFRTVFMLRAIEELTVEETAACLGIPEATVRSRYFRAKGLLRESLSRDIDFALEGAFSFDGERCDRIVAAVLAGLAHPSAGGP